MERAPLVAEETRHWSLVTVGISLSPETQIHVVSRSLYTLRYGMHVFCARAQKSNKAVNVVLVTC